MLQMNDKSHRITLRLNDAQFKHVTKSADMLGVSPSEFLRMVINATMYAEKAVDKAAESISAESEDSRRENETSVQHDIL